MPNELKLQNEANLKEVLMEILLIDDAEFDDSKGPDDIETWDSLATVSIAVAIEEKFDHHMSVDEVAKIKTIGDIKVYLRSKGVEL